MRTIVHRTPRRLRPRHPLVIVLAFALLAACSAPGAQITYRDVRATAVVTGCWPGNYPTPNPVPVASGDPMPTPYRPCASAGAPVVAPYPTPVPYPTQHPIIVNAGNDLVTALELPFLHHVDVAVHPSAGWAAVASVWTDDYHGSDGGPSRRIFVRVFSPVANTWSPARQVNPPPTEDGNGLYGGVALGITGDGAVHAVWGGAFTSGKPVWYAQSRDYGTTWSTPQQIGAGCYSVANMATTLDGQLVVLALCTPSTTFAVRPGLIVRRADGTWLPQEDISVDGRWGSVVVLGDGPDARAVALLTSANGSAGHLVQKRLGAAGAWQVRRINLAPPAGLYPASATYYLHRGMTFRRPNGSDGI
ncbi:MAG TPA: sialidase family protein, partial [Herpetosiphonaceae bacterium]|nr:sialidase family protein [Herpetosiphonaceae bacterium]